jgi:hypothetical protein
MHYEIKHTQYEAAYAEKAMHRIESPFDTLLEIWCTFPDDEIEKPICAGRQRNTFGTNSQRHDLSKG